MSHVTFGFDKALVLHDVSLAVESGGLVGLLGPNGSGKTTLLRVIAGALRPGSGRVTMDQTDVTGLSRRDLARRLAVVPQETQLAFDYTALEIALMGRYPHLGAFEIEGPEDLDIAMRALHATGTGELASRPFRTLSGGEKQRVVIASALAQLGGFDRAENTERAPTQPALLLLDEPTASLDLRYQLEVASVLRRLHDHRSMTIMLSTHDLRFAASLCTTVVLLSRGRVLAQGAPTEVLTAEAVGALYEIDPALAAPLLA